MYPFGLVAGVYPAAVAAERLAYLASVALVCVTSRSAAACWAAVGVPEGTGAITMPLAMVVAPFTLAQTVDVVCAAPVDDDEVPILIPAIDPELPAALVPDVAPLDADALGAG